MTWRTPFVSYLCWGELTITLTLNSLTSAFPNNPTWNFKADFFHQSLWKGCKNYATLQSFPLRRQLFEKNLGWTLTHYICLQSQRSLCLSYCNRGCLIYFSLCSRLVNILTTPFTCANNRPTDNPRTNDLMQSALLTLSVWMTEWGEGRRCVCVFHRSASDCLFFCFLGKYMHQEVTARSCCACVCMCLWVRGKEREAGIHLQSDAGALSEWSDANVDSSRKETAICRRLDLSLFPTVASQKLRAEVDWLGNRTKFSYFRPTKPWPTCFCLPWW